MPMKRVFSNAIDTMAYFLSALYLRPNDGAETEKLEAKLKVTLPEMLKERVGIYATMKPSFFERMLGQTPNIGNTFATLVHHWVFSKMNLNRRVAENFAEDLVGRIYSLHPPEIVREAENSFE
jgi:hypothetical protein